MKKKVRTKELIWYIITGVIWVAGLGLLVTGIVGSYLPGLAKDNPIMKAEQSMASWLHMNLDFKWLGIILIVIGAVVATCVLLYYAKRHDIDQDRALKRAQRLGDSMSAND